MFADLTLAGATSFQNVGYYMGGPLEGCMYLLRFALIRLSIGFNCCVATEGNNDSKMIKRTAILTHLIIFISPLSKGLATGLSYIACLSQELQKQQSEE